MHGVCGSLIDIFNVAYMQCQAKKTLTLLYVIVYRVS